MPVRDLELVALAELRTSGALTDCARGELVWAPTDGWKRGRVLRRAPGEVQVQRMEAPFAGSNTTLPPTELRARFGGLCARAALCLFGRVGNLRGKFDEEGSTEEALEIAAASVWEHVVRANADLHWDVFAHTWDEDLATAIHEAYMPVTLKADPQPEHLPTVGSFGETFRRSVELKRIKEEEEGFRYDLVVLMRYDVLFRSPLRVSPAVGSSALWTGHWCSIHAEDLAVREVVLTHDRNISDVRYKTSGIYAPSQFATVGLHDFWFAASSRTMDNFASWGSAVPALRARFGLVSADLPVDVGHFYTFLHAKSLGLPLEFTGISYIDYTLVRYRDCKLLVGEQIQDPDQYCSHWEISVTRQCSSWLPQPRGWAAQYCPLAGKRAELAPFGSGCGRF
eukprot:s3782_g4.t1